MYSNDVVGLRPARARALAGALRQERARVADTTAAAHHLLGRHGLDPTVLRPTGGVVDDLERWSREVDLAVDRILGLQAEPRRGATPSAARRAARQVIGLVRRGTRRERARAARLLARHAADPAFAHALFAGLPGRALAVQVGLLASLRRAGVAGADRSVQQRVVAGLGTALATHLAGHGRVDVHAWVDAAGGPTPAGALALLLGSRRYPTGFLVDLARELVVIPNRERLAGRAIAGPDDFRPLALEAVARDPAAARQVVAPDVDALLPSRLEYVDRGAALAAVLDAAMVPFDPRIGRAVITWIGRHPDVPDAVADDLPALLSPYLAAFRRWPDHTPGLEPPLPLDAGAVDAVLGVAFSTPRRAGRMQRAAARWAVEVTDAALTGGHPERLGGVAAVMGSLARADGRAAERRAEDADDARDARRRLISTTESALTAIPVTRVVLRTGQTLTTLFGDGLLDRWMPASNHLVDELRRSGRRTLHYLESIAAVVEYLTAARGFGAEPRDPVITAVLRGMARRPTVSADIAAVVGDAYIDEALAP